MQVARPDGMVPPVNGKVVAFNQGATVQDMLHRAKRSSPAVERPSSPHVYVKGKNDVKLGAANNGAGQQTPFAHRTLMWLAASHFVACAGCRDTGRARYTMFLFICLLLPAVHGQVVECDAYEPVMTLAESSSLGHEFLSDRASAAESVATSARASALVHGLEATQRLVVRVLSPTTSSDRWSRFCTHQLFMSP